MHPTHHTATDLTIVYAYWTELGEIYFHRQRSALIEVRMKEGSQTVFSFIDFERRKVNKINERNSPRTEISDRACGLLVA